MNPGAVHPDRIARCFGAHLSDTQLSSMRENPRFSTRLTQLVDETFDVPPIGENADTVDHYLCTLTAAQLAVLGRRAGVVMHAHSFVMEISGPVIVLLEDRFGPQAMLDARLYRDLAGERVDHTDLPALETAVESDGTACLAAWIDTLSLNLRRRVTLAWADDGAVPVNHRPELAEMGPIIIRRLAQDNGAKV